MKYGFFFIILTSWIFIYASFILLHGAPWKQLCSEYKAEHGFQVIGKELANSEIRFRAQIKSIPGHASNGSSDRHDSPEACLLTLFTTFENTPRRMTIQQRTIENWSRFRPIVQPILYYSRDLDETLISEARNHGWIVYPCPALSSKQVPLLKGIFRHAINASRFLFYGHANGDMLFRFDLIETLVGVTDFLPQFHEVLITGSRTDCPWDPHFDRDGGGCAGNASKRQQSSNAQDYFITTATGFPWTVVPEFVIGRTGYDNWLLVTALVRGTGVIDASSTVLAVHQAPDEGNYSSRHVQSADDAQVNYAMAGKFDYSLGLTNCATFETTRGDQPENVTTYKATHGDRPENTATLESVDSGLRPENTAIVVRRKSLGRYCKRA